MDLITLAMAKAYSDSKGGYTEPGKTLADLVLHPLGDGEGTKSGYTLSEPIGLEVGKTYTVVTDSGTYTGVAKLDSNSIILGNTVFWGGDDTGETYIVIEAASNEDGLVADFNNGERMKISETKTTVPFNSKYLPEGGVGYTEPGMVLTYDGNKEGKEVVVDTFVKLTNKALDLNTVNHIAAFVHGEASDFEKSALSAATNGDMQQLALTGDNFPFAVSIFADTVLGQDEDGLDVILTVGTYVTDNGNGSYAARIEFTETIHPIEPKYLPGVCLPVVEITSAEYPTDGTLVALSETEGMAFDKAVSEGIPCVVKLTFNGMPLAICCLYFNGSYVGFMGDQQFGFFFDNSRWTMGG